jgi:D-amino-acid dehydrogenase
MNVLVIGSGIIGITSAYYLSKAGANVTVLEKNPGPAQEASSHNGAQLAWSHVPPLGGPTLFGYIREAMRGQDPGLQVKKWMDPLLWRWGLGLMANSVPERAEFNLLTLLNLARRSQELMREFRADAPIEFDFRETGKLHVFDDTRSFDAARRFADRMAARGVRQIAQTPENCVTREPFLLNRIGRMAGGIFSASDSTGDCGLFCENLSAWLAKEKNVAFRYNAAMMNFIMDGNAVRGVRTMEDD